MRKEADGRANRTNFSDSGGRDGSPNANSANGDFNPIIAAPNNQPLNAGDHGSQGNRGRGDGGNTRFCLPMNIEAGNRNGSAGGADLRGRTWSLFQQDDAAGRDACAQEVVVRLLNNGAIAGEDEVRCLHIETKSFDSTCTQLP